MISMKDHLLLQLFGNGGLNDHIVGLQQQH
jgi:hypothetical protein